MTAEKQKMILLVEDEVITAMSEKMTLEKYGYKVITAYTGEEAVALVEKTPAIDLILMDIDLGAGMDGTEAAAIILQSRDLPVVFLSSHTEPEVVARTEKITFYGYVVKNSSNTVLDASIKMAFKLFEAKLQEKKKEAALQNSEETLRYIIKHDPNAIAVYDRGLHYIAVSDRYLRDYNVREEDIIGKHHYQVFPEMPQKWKDVHRRCLAGAIEGNEDDSFERPDGSVTHNRWQCRPWRRLDGEIGGIVTYTEVTTDRKNAEMALRASESRAQALLRTIPDMLFRVDRGGVFLDYRADAKDLYYQSGASFIGKSYREILPPDFADLIDVKIRATLETGALQTFEYRLPVPGRGEQDYEARMAASGADEVTAIVRDITERKQAESQREAAVAAQRESEKRLRDIIFSMADWVWEVNEKGVYTYSSDKGLEFFGASRGDIIGKTPFDFMPPEEAKRVGAIFSEIAANKRPIKDLENWNIGKNGERICLLTNGVPILDEKGDLKGYRGVDKDISERKRAEAALQDAQIRYRLLFEHSPDGIVIIDPGTTRILEFNETAHKQLGYSREEFSRLSIPDIDADETPEETHEHIARVMDEGLNTFETRQRTRQGEIKNILVTAQFTRIGGRPIYHCIWRDITEHKRAEKEKEQIISLQKATIESTADGILVIDHAGKITDFNQHFARMWRIPDSVLAARDDAQALHFVLDQLLDPNIFMAKVNELYAAPEQESFDLLQLKDGRFFERYSRPQLISGRPLGRVWSFRDISERRQVEEALRQSEERFRTLYENSPLGLYRTTPDGRIHLANLALIRMLGYSSFADLAKLDLEQGGFAPSHPRARFIENIEKHGEVKGLEYSWKRHDGATIIVRESARAIRDARGKTQYYDGIVEDISESKRAEKLPETLYKISQAVYATDNLNELFDHVHRALAEIIPMDNLFIALLSDDGRALTFPYFIDEKNPNDTASIQADNLQSLTVEVLSTKRSLLLNEVELLGRYASGRNRVWGTAPKCWLGVPLLVREKVIGVMAVQDYRKAGAYVDKDVKLLESTAGQIAIAIDRKRTEEALRESIDSFKGYFNMGTVGMCVSSLETGWIEVNDCLCRMLGYSREELLRLTWAEMTHPDDLYVDLDLFNQVLAGERDSYELEKRFIRKDGQVIYTQLYATCQRNPDGTVHHLLASLVDISERKRAEEGMQNTLRFQQALMDAVPSPIFYKDAKCVYIGGNKAFEQFIGLAQEKFIGRTVYDISPADLAEKYDEADRELLKNKGIQTYEASAVYADGTRHAVIFNKALFTDAEGKVAGLIGVILDISERKRSEILEQAVYEIARAADKAANLDDLYRSVHRIIQTLMPATNILIARYDEKENLVSFPYFVDEKDPVPKPRKSSRGLTDYVLRTGRTLLSDAALEKELERSGEAKRRGSPSACWLGVPLKTGDKTIGVIALDNYSDPKAYGERERKILEYVSSQIASAIERKQAEAEIKRQLAEKEVLLKEVHHRIKNNIASIAGLISLRLQSISNPEAAAVLKDAVGRVDSMRILYDKLLLSDGYADISVKNYLETLIDTIAAIFPDDVEIRVEKHIADFHLDAKKLFPLGIIINELLTNKMKYAFSGRKRGSIRIDLALADNRAKLTIADDGNALPPGFDVKEAKGFGLMLVKMLSQQLGGSFAIEDHAGVRCTVEFDI